MRKIVGLLLMFALLVFALPFAGLLLKADTGTAPAPGSVGALSAAGSSAASGAVPQASVSGSELLHIYNEDTKEVDEVTVRQYVIGSVASEMPSSWPDEALKAQAVASHSYAMASKALAKAGLVTVPENADFSARPNQRLGWANEQALRSAWGEEYADKMARISALVDTVLDEVLMYAGQPAMACYSAISNGVTETSEVVWGTAMPYLTNVASPYDLLAENYEKTITMDAGQVKDCLTLSFSGMDLTGDADTWFGSVTHTTAGGVATQRIGGVVCKGTDVRTALGLRSTTYTVQYADGSFTFTTRGYGHGVGMSQWGAKGEAENGKTYQQILAQYYPTATLETVQ